MKVCLFGLGEAGSLFAQDLVGAGVEVAAYDPAPVLTPDGVQRLPHPALAAHNAEIVMSLTSESDAKLALLQAIEVIDDEALYADLSTSSPAIKADLEKAASRCSFDFVDVALMAMVPGNGIRTPSLAAGSGAQRYVDSIASFGGEARLVSGSAGTAAGRKLLRSVMMKGMAAVATEAMMAGQTAGDLAWLWENLVDEITGADEEWLRRLITGTEVHHVRRTEEMLSAQSLLAQLGINPIMTSATVASLREVPELEFPTLP